MQTDERLNGKVRPSGHKKTGSHTLHGPVLPSLDATQRIRLAEGQSSSKKWGTSKKAQKLLELPFGYSLAKWHHAVHLLYFT